MEIWQRALDYADQIHEIADVLPKHERYNLADQMTRAANSIALNIAVQRLLLRWQSEIAWLRAQRDRPASATPNRIASSVSLFGRYSKQLQAST